MVRRLIKTIFGFFISAVVAPTAFATDSTAVSGCPASGSYEYGLLEGLPCNEPTDDLDLIVVVLQNISGTVLAILSTLFVIMIIIGGIQYITAAGNENRASSGKKTLTAAVIGLIIVILAYAIIKIFATLLGGGVG